MPAPQEIRQVLLVSKTDEWCERAGLLARLVFGDRLAWIRGQLGDPLPQAVAEADADYLVSFISPWIIPGSVLARVKHAINFHPGSREYPGIGCYNFALYEGATQYGAVCHYMAEKVDTGKLIAEKLFPVFTSDTVETLKYRTMVVMLELFHDIICRIAVGGPVPELGKPWLRTPRTRRELNALTVITPDMPAEEVQRRIRATTYPGKGGPEMSIGGAKFFYPVPDRKPLA